MRSHISINNDQEANAAASFALRGAAVGACKVCHSFRISVRPPCLPFSPFQASRFLVLEAVQ